MPITTDSLNKKLYDLLKVQGYDPVPKNSKGETTPVPDDADVFRFTFKVDGKPVGPAWITVDSNQELKVYYDDKVMNGLQEDGGEGQIDDFTEFLQQLKRWAQRRQLGFDLENQDHLESDMAQREHVKKQEQINEGYYPMGKTASYNDSVPSVKIVLQHTRAIQEGEQRFRNIAKIFLENTEGERILAPTTRPGIAKVYARHLAEGGLPHDERWGHIGSLVEEYTKMAGFVRATRGGQFNESAQQLVNEGINHYQSLRETLSRMIGHKGYNAYFESWTPALMETEGEESSLNELFVQETLDPRIESVMPILNRIHKKVNEMSEVKALEEWADKLIGEATDLPSIPEEDLEEGIADDYEDMADRELMRHARMLGLEKNIVQDGEGGLANRQEMIYLLQQEAGDDLDEAGKPGLWANIHAKRERIKKGSGERMRKPGSKGAPSAQDFKDAAKTSNEGIGDVAKKVGSALKTGAKAVGKAIVGPDDDELLRDLKKRAGVRNPQTGKPSMAHSDVEKVDEDLGPEQKKVGQLGPTEKVKNNNIGKLVGANESVEEGIVDWAKEKYHDYQTGRQWNKFGKAQRKGDTAGMQAAQDAAAAHRDKLQVARQNRTGSTLSKDSSMGVGQDVANLKALKAKGLVKEGQEDLDAILRIIRK